MDISSATPVIRSCQPLSSVPGTGHSTGHQRPAQEPPYRGLALIKNLDNRSLEAIECTKPDGGVVSTIDREAVIAFLNLSEDELDLRAQRWISADSWGLWRSGMAARLRRWPFDQVWDQVRNTEHTQHDDVDGQYSQLRNAGSALYETGFDPRPPGKHRPWQGR